MRRGCRVMLAALGIALSGCTARSVLWLPLATGDADRQGGDNAPHGRYLLGTATDGTIGELIAMAVDPITNDLTELAGSPYPLPARGYQMLAVGGDRVVITDYANDLLRLYRFDPTSGPVELDSASIPGPYGLALHPSLPIVFVGSDTLVFEVEVAPASLTARASTAFGGGSPSSLAIGRDAGSLLVVTWDVNPSVYSVTMDALGGLSPSAVTPLEIDDPAPWDFVVTPSGDYGVIAPDVNGGVPAFTIAPDGGLSMTPGSEFGSDACVCVDAAMDPLGRFALLGCHCGCDVQAYTIGSNGALTQAPGSPYDDDELCPNSILITDDSRVWVAAADTVYRHTAAADGTLSPVPGVAFPTSAVRYIEAIAFVEL